MREYYLGLDIGGSKTRAILLGENEEYRSCEVRYDNRQLNKDELERVIEDVLQKISLGSDVDLAGIGAAVPSVVIGGKPKFLHINPALEYLDIKNFLQDKFKTKVILENDVNLAALGEWRFGQNRDPESLFLINLGTGCGAGFVKGGEIMRGHYSSAFEIGHLKMREENDAGASCACGGVDHVENYLSSRFFKSRNLDSRVEAEKAGGGDVESIKLFKEFGKHLGSVVGDMVNLIEPEKIIIAGGLSSLYNLYLEEAICAAKERIFIKELADNFSLFIATTGADAPALGAAFLVKKSKK